MSGFETGVLICDIDVFFAGTSSEAGIAKWT
jgi:hypothetical protein